MDDRQQDAPVRPAVEGTAFFAPNGQVVMSVFPYGDWPVTAIDGTPAEVARRVRAAVEIGVESWSPDLWEDGMARDIAARVLAALAIEETEVRDGE